MQTLVAMRWMLLLVVLLLSLGGCSSRWGAPLESRGRIPSPPPVSRAPAPLVPTPERRRILKASQYRVQRGDTLYSIAWRANLDFRSLARWNGIRAPYVIYPGQVIRLCPPAVPAHRGVRQTPTRQAEPRRATGARSSAPAKAPQSRARRDQGGSKDAARPRSLRWTWPAKGRLVAFWKAGDPLRKGIKIAGREGQPVLAAEGGKVVYSGSGLIGYGRLIIIKHNDNYLSAYGHNRKLLVRQDQRVTKGQKIAEMGRANDGRSLLHFEIRRDGKPVDPLKLLPRR